MHAIAVPIVTPIFASQGFKFFVLVVLKTEFQEVELFPRKSVRSHGSSELSNAVARTVLDNIHNIFKSLKIHIAYHRIGITFNGKLTYTI